MVKVPPEKKKQRTDELELVKTNLNTDDIGTSGMESQISTDK